MTSIRAKLVVAFTAIALAAIAGMAVGGFTLLRSRARAQARAAFADAREGLERSLDGRYRELVQVANLSYLSPVIRSVTSRMDASDFGLGSSENDAENLKELHDNLVDASWDWSSAAREGSFAVADYKGRILYAHASPATWGGDTTALPAVREALDAGTSGGHIGSTVLATDDPRLEPLGLLPAGQKGLVLLMARAEVLRGRPQAVFLQLVGAERILADAPPGVDVSLRAESGATDGTVAAAVAAQLFTTGAAPVEIDAGHTFLAQAFPIVGPGGERPIATLLVAQDLTAALAEMTRPAMFPLVGLALGLLAIAAIAALLLAGRFTRPIEALEEAAQRVAAGDLATRVTASGTGDEIDRLAGTFNDMAAGLEERERIKSTFKKYLAPDVVDYLLAHPEAQALGGSRRELTVMFSDIERFTALAEARPPEEVVIILNRYFTRVSEKIAARGGTVDKYIGDAVMSFFGAPVPRADHARRAVEAAFDHLAVIDELAHLEGPRLEVRIGLNTGEMIVGNIGGGAAQDYTVIGDAVNLAERVEAVNRDYGTRLLATESTVQAAGDGVTTREIERAVLPGRVAPVTLYELIPPRLAARASFQLAAPRYAEGLASYRARRFAEAAAAFKGALEALPGDGPAKVLLARAENYCKLPPPDDWDGIWRKTSK